MNEREKHDLIVNSKEIEQIHTSELLPPELDESDKKDTATGSALCPLPM